MKAIDRFNIRVYGLLRHADHVLVADETIAGKPITKFPGGGLEYGEGPMDCLVREIREELDMEAVGLRHFYTTSFFQRSAYRENEQIISIYYTFQVQDGTELELAKVPLGPGFEAGLRIHWLPLTLACVQRITLPIDRVVLGLLVENEG